MSQLTDLMFVQDELISHKGKTKAINDELQQTFVDMSNLVAGGVAALGVSGQAEDAADSQEESDEVKHHLLMFQSVASGFLIHISLLN